MQNRFHAEVIPIATNGPLRHALDLKCTRQQNLYTRLTFALASTSPDARDYGNYKECGYNTSNESSCTSSTWRRTFSKHFSGHGRRGNHYLVAKPPHVAIVALADKRPNPVLASAVVAVDAGTVVNPVLAGGPPEIAHAPAGEAGAVG